MHSAVFYWCFNAGYNALLFLRLENNNIGIIAKIIINPTITLLIIAERINIFKPLLIDANQNIKL